MACYMAKVQGIGKTGGGVENGLPGVSDRRLGNTLAALGQHLVQQLQEQL